MKIGDPDEEGEDVLEEIDAVRTLAFKTGKLSSEEKTLAQENLLAFFGVSPMFRSTVRASVQPSVQPSVRPVVVVTRL